MSTKVMANIESLNAAVDTPVINAKAHRVYYVHKEKSIRAFNLS